MTADHARAQLSLFHAPRAAPVEDFGALCFDCGVDTLEIDEFYMVREDVWLAACPWNYAGGMFDFLCVGCLEARIGRELARADFADCLLNELNRRDAAASSRLRARMEVAG